MKPFNDIFTKPTTKPKKESMQNPKTPIIIDTREKQSLTAANLIEKKANIKFEKLEIGDYLIKDIIIERKTLSDFAGSIINKRLQEQLSNLKKYPRYFLLLEGFDYDYENLPINENAIRGMLLSIATDFQIPIIYTKDSEDTANFLLLLAKKYERTQVNFSIRHSKNQKSLEEQKQFILEGFPGIGPTIAKSLLEEHKTLEKIFKLPKSKLKEIPKLDDKKIEKFKKLLRK